MSDDLAARIREWRSRIPPPYHALTGKQATDLLRDLAPILREIERRLPGARAEAAPARPPVGVSRSLLDDIAAGRTGPDY